MKTTLNTQTHRATARKLGTIICLLGLLLFGWGCEDAKVVDQKSTPNNSKNNDPGGGETDEFGHGPDENAESFEVGVMTGSWRVARAEDQSLIANIDIMQEENNPELSGYFAMGTTVGNGADDAGGDLLSASSFDGETLILKWNPTPNPDEVYTVEATPEDRDKLVGKLTALVYSDLNADVVITRYATPPVDEQNEDDTAGDIDAGGQGGAGGN